MANITPLDRPVPNHCGTDFLIFFIISILSIDAHTLLTHLLQKKKEKHALVFVSVLKSTMRAKIVID